MALLLRSPMLEHIGNLQQTASEEPLELLICSPATLRELGIA